MGQKGSQGLSQMGSKQGGAGGSPGSLLRGGRRESGARGGEEALLAECLKSWEA